jgi:hypothetical protein
MDYRNTSTRDDVDGRMAGPPPVYPVADTGFT